MQKIILKRFLLMICAGSIFIVMLAGCEDNSKAGNERQRQISTNTKVTPWLQLCVPFMVRLSDGTVFFGNPDQTLHKMDTQGVTTSLPIRVDNIAKDIHDNVYVASNGVIVKIGPHDEMKTLAGRMLQGTKRWTDSNIDGVGSDARFSSIHAMAADNKGNLYVQHSSMPHALIRKVTPEGTVTTVFANASVASFSNNWDFGAFAVDSKGNKYLGTNGSIIKINVRGNVETFAGREGGGSRAPRDGQGSDAVFGDYITRITIDPKDNLYVVVNSSRYQIRKISPTGYVTTLAGEFAENPSNSAPIYPGAFVDGDERGNWIHPHSNIDVDSNGNLYFFECNNNALRELTVDGRIITLIRGRLNPVSW